MPENCCINVQVHFLVELFYVGFRLSWFCQATVILLEPICRAWGYNPKHQFGSPRELSEPEIINFWKAKTGTLPLQCGGHQYTGPVKGIGSGTSGVLVQLHRGSESGPKVVAKLFQGDPKEENLSHECEIYRLLQRHHVPNTLTCEAACVYSGCAMIILSPFVEEDSSQFPDDLPESYFDDDDALRRAVFETLRTGKAMLEAGVANSDQSLNILYGKDGSTTFIDMGLATNLREASRFDQGYRSEQFISHVLGKVPESWWLNGRASTILQDRDATARVTRNFKKYNQTQKYTDFT